MIQICLAGEQRFIISQKYVFMFTKSLNPLYIQGIYRSTKSTETNIRYESAHGDIEYY